MAVVTVRAPGKVNRRIAGVTFSEGRAEVDTDSAAYQFFKRRGYKIREAAPEKIEGETPAVDSEIEESTAEPDEAPDEAPDEESDEESSDELDEESAAARPHPVQGSKAVWFEYLTQIKPDHGFDLETVTRKDLVAAVEAIEAE